MKKIFSILVLSVVFIISGCLEVNDTNPDNYDVDVQLEMNLNNEVRGIDFVMDIDMPLDMSEVEDFRFVLRYKVNATTEDLDAKLDLPGTTTITFLELEGSRVIETLADVSLDYENDYVSAYLEVFFSVANESFEFSIDSIVTTNLYALALQSSGDFAEEIIEAVSPNDELPELELFTDVALNNEARGFDLSSTVVTQADTNDVIIEARGFVFVLNDETEFTVQTNGADLVVLDILANSDVLDSFEHTLADVLFDYSLDRIYLRSFVTIKVGALTHTYYSNISNFTLYELALDTTGDFAEEIIEAVEYQEPDETVISHVSILVNTSDYVVTNKPQMVVVNVTTNYLIVTVEVILDDTLSWSNQVTFKFNNQVIQSSEYTINGQTITYQFDDPNWSGIY
ncbi:MAG: hypothetical protein WCZ19_05090 [Acholeplasma sp.]